MTGHLFAIHGDLRRLACDALVVPCDSDVNVNPAWRELLPADRLSAGDADWLRVDVALTRGHARLPDVEGRAVHLADTVGGVRAVEDLVERAVQAVNAAAASASRHEGRIQPLVGLPLVGTGAGGLARRRGAVAQHLVERLVDELAGSSYDVALVLHDARDFAAVQELRTSAAWGELSERLIAVADDLGGRAARGELSLFLGSGVSVPVGLPNWRQLLEELAAAVPMDVPSAIDENMPEAAEAIRARLGELRYRELMSSRFEVSRYALSHGLLAGLGARQLVTTNYDPCMELAMEAVLGADELRVMTRHLAWGDRPWLLKLHGDILRPETLVLTTSDYRRLEQHDGALHGVVQGLMLTSHLLFVGFSLVDEDFLELATEVQRIRRQAEEEFFGETHPTAGTALSLYEGAVAAEALREDLDILPVSTLSDDRAAARMLEIFLDRLAWAADRNRPLSAQYLLDERYDDGFTDPADRHLREALRRLVDHLDVDAGRSSGWHVLERALRSLGADPADLERFMDRRDRWV